MVARGALARRRELKSMSRPGSPACRRWRYCWPRGADAPPGAGSVPGSESSARVGEAVQHGGLLVHKGGSGLCTNCLEPPAKTWKRKSKADFQFAPSGRRPAAQSSGPCSQGSSPPMTLLVAAPALAVDAAALERAPDGRTAAHLAAPRHACGGGAGSPDRLRPAPCQQMQPYLPPGLAMRGRTRVGLRCGTAWRAGPSRCRCRSRCLAAPWWQPPPCPPAARL